MIGHNSSNKPDRREVKAGRTPQLTWVTHREFKQAVRQGRSERRGEAYSVPYVEPLSEARTQQADSFQRPANPARVSLSSPGRTARRPIPPRKSRQPCSPRDRTSRV